MRFLWTFLRRRRGVLILALSLATINQVFSLLDPQIFRLLVDRYASHPEQYTADAFLRGAGFLLLASVGVAFVSRVAKNFQDYCLNLITQRLGTELYASSIAHSFALPYAAFEDQRSGELLAKLQKARTDAEALVKSLVNVVFFSLIGILFVLAYAFTVHWLIGSLYLLAIPILGGVTFLISRNIKAAQERVIRESAALAGSTTETLRNVELVKSLGLEEQEIRRLNTVNDRILDLELKKIILIRRLSFVQGTTINAVRSALILLMVWLVFVRALTLGELFSLFVYSFFIFTPLAELGTVASEYQQALASLGRLQEILAQPPEPKPATAVAIGQLRAVTFSDVHFTHRDAEQPAVRGVSFTIQAGETIAFVGPSGSGKTTIVKLLCALYRPSQGTITINGVDSRQIDLEALRLRIGLVAQETQLFAGTIRENLLFVRPTATDADCLAALRAAAAQSILDRSVRGLDTRIGEGGLKLSGGERQRLAIARALLRAPDLIIFDEATSSLDSITEKAITETIQSIERERPELTTIIVAHRLSTVAHADRIIVLERGRIVEQGTHDALLVRAGLYAALWREQSAASSSHRFSA